MARGPQTVERQRNINPIIPLGVGAVLIIGLFIGVASLGGDDGPTASSVTTTAPTTTAPPPDPIDLADLDVTPFAEQPLSRYVVTYDVVENDLARTERLVVARPYESLNVAERDGALISGTATSRAQLWTYLADRSGWLAIQSELHRAAFDQHPLLAMNAMMQLGLATEGEPDTVLGRPCRTFTVGQPLNGGAAKAPSDAESVEACLDATGLVLREVWSLEGSVVSERVATSVEEDPAIDPAGFDPTPVTEGGAEYEALLATTAEPADAATIAALQVDVVAPASYQLESTVVRTGGAAAGTGVVEVVRFYSDGLNLVEVAEVTVGSGDADLSIGNAIPVTVPDGGPLGDDAEVWFAPEFRASALRVRLSEGSYFEIRGVDPALLVEVFNSISLR